MGDAGVGKTSLIHQLTKKQFNEVVMPTLGVDFSAKNLPSEEDNTTIRLHLWDLAGRKVLQTLLYWIVDDQVKKGSAVCPELI